MTRRPKPTAKPPAKLPAKKKKKTPVLPAAGGAPSDDAEDDDETEITAPEDDTDEGASNTSTTKKRQDRKLTDKQEIDMLEFLRSNICMWDMQCIDYRNAQKKQALWETAAKTVGDDLTAGHLKAAFKNLRNWNTKLDKECSKSGSAPRQMTGRDIQVQTRMDFMKNTVTHRPAPLASSRGRGADETIETIETLDDEAMEPPKKRTSRAASSASTSADAEGLLTLQNVIERHNDKLHSMVTKFHSPSPAPHSDVVNLDDPQSASRGIQKSYCSYVTSCVMTYDEQEFDQFQSAFTLIHEQFKAARRAKVHRQQALAEQAAARYTYAGTPHTISSVSAPVAFQLYSAPATVTTQTTPSQQYQLDAAHWATETPAPLQGASLYASQTAEYNAQYRTLTARPQPLQARPLPVLQTLPLATTTLQSTAEPPLPNIRRIATSTPKRDTTGDVLNLSDMLNRSTTTNPAEDSQDIVLSGLD